MLYDVVAVETRPGFKVWVRFENGVAKTLDVLDAMTARREAEARELVARAEAHLATLRLALAAGRRPETALTGKLAGAPSESSTR